MAVENRIVKVQKRNRALVRFDAQRIRAAVLRAGKSVGGLKQDLRPGINDRLFTAWETDEQIAGFLADLVVVLLNARPHHLIANFPPTVETIQDAVLHVLRAHGFQHTADAYACYRWGRHWLREGAISQEQFTGMRLAETEAAHLQAWNREHGCNTLHALNKLVEQRRLGPLVHACIARYDAAIDVAVNKILGRIPGGLRMIWVTGPSSSGKTTTAIKLTERLGKAGLRFVVLNLDDYFWSLVEHPTDWINDRNYETPEAMDIQLLNEQLRALLAGKVVRKPVFDFKQGRRVANVELALRQDEVLLLDCLHGLYPPLIEGIEPSAQFRLYLDTQLGVEPDPAHHAVVPNSSDVRLLRRMLRDARHRNHSPLRTLLHWHYVRSGELYSILPLRGLADHVINTAFPYELPALKAFFSGSESYLPGVEELGQYAGFMDAEIRHSRLAQLLNSILGLTRAELENYELIPGDAVVREFIGGSTLAIPHND